MTILRSTTPITPIRIAGRIRGNPWCGPPPSVKPAANNGRDGRGLAPGPNDLNVPSIPLDRISGLLLNWWRTYEMDI